MEIKINGVTLTANPFELEWTSKWQTERSRLIKKFEKLQKEDPSGDIKKYIMKVRNGIVRYFDAIWGEGTAHKIFGDKIDILEMQKTFLSAEKEIVALASEERVKAFMSDKLTETGK